MQVGPNTMPRPTNNLFSYEPVPDDKSPTNVQYSLSHNSPSGMTVGSEYRDLQKMLSKKMENTEDSFYIPQRESSNSDQIKAYYPKLSMAGGDSKRFNDATRIEDSDTRIFKRQFSKL